MRKIFLYKLNIILTSVLLIFSSFLNAQIKDTLLLVGSHHLNFRIIDGIGCPIIFESGAGNDGSVWEEIMLLLAKRINAPLIAYDRAGFGESEIDTLNINIQTEIRDLGKGLEKLGFKDNYFLVSHSLGGAYAMRFSVTQREKVKGGVFIDIVTPYFTTKKRAQWTKNQFIDSLASIKKESLGFYHLVLNYVNTAKVMRKSSKDLQVPLTVIASGITPFEGKTRNEFIAALKRFAGEKSNRKYIIIPDAEHYVFYDRPGLVVEEIISLYAISTKNL